MGNIGRYLVEWVICPNCWQRFEPSDVLFVARHQDLVGDPIAGAENYLRFRPSRFTLEGAAIDPAGLPCDRVACPRCHLEFARSLLEMRPLYLSLVGAPASGKSYLLASMIWKLRQHLPELGLTLNDADPEFNQRIHEYEQTLFLNMNPHQPVAIQKTETEGANLYWKVNFDGQEQLLPRPFQFALARDGSAKDAFTLVLYDNAGEHFLPGQDATRLPVTRHLSRSGAILYLFDPLQDPRIRQKCTIDAVEATGDGRVSVDHAIRQELLLAETAARVRRLRGLSERDRLKIPLIVILPKADVWLHSLLEAETIALLEQMDDARAGLDKSAVRAVSNACRAMLTDICPELVTAAESFYEYVTYLPVTALGQSPVLTESNGRRFYGIKPGEIAPRWVMLPFVYALSLIAPQLCSPEVPSGGCHEL